MIRGVCFYPSVVVVTDFFRVPCFKTGIAGLSPANRNKHNITNSHLAHFIYFDYYFSQSGYKAFLQLYICKGYRYVA